MARPLRVEFPGVCYRRPPPGPAVLYWHLPLRSATFLPHPNGKSYPSLSLCGRVHNA